MTEQRDKKISNFLKHAIRPHPWHGIKALPVENNYSVVNAFIEIVPSDTVKYELDKESGYMTIDRPHKLSNMMPCMYGFVPRTYCDKKVAAHTRKATGDDSINGDQDPLDICVFSDRTIASGDFFLQAKILGGFRMLDGGEADDKIIAVLKDDHVYGGFDDVEDLPKQVLMKLKHYFLTYKEIPVGVEKPKVEITHTYGAIEAQSIVRLACEDYSEAMDFDLD